ncbi:LOW QUALITY PROTEIN: hypothetical protein U9M48_001313 [Paspalum notatum var. saurae]|uniref:Disease resistance protein RPM1 n=1 Tax=Paspalum notatum var. saurae TaxID=547442 RepID=A0AAQ3PP48_PASNO
MRCSHDPNRLFCKLRPCPSPFKPLLSRERSAMDAQGALSSVLNKLAVLLADECARLKGVRREIRFLQAELNNMHAVLQKCAAMENRDIQVKAWTKELRELAYDIEDCVDNFVHGVDIDHRRHGARGIKEFFRKCVRRLRTLVARHRISNQIQELKARVVEVAEQRVRYKLDDQVSSIVSSCNRPIDPRLCALFAEESHLVGIDGPRDELASWLLDDDEVGGVIRRKVLSIYGFGGLGKSTLANEIRHKIGKQFDFDALVSVSQKPDFRKILWSVLSRIDKKRERDMGRWNDHRKDKRTPATEEPWHTFLNPYQVQRCDRPSAQRLAAQRRTMKQLSPPEPEPLVIPELLVGTPLARMFVMLKESNRYFVIIDDIWCVAAWDLLKCALPENNKGSRVITTTRIESVARACCALPSDRCYKIEPLNEFHSRSLLFKRIFGCEGGCPDKIEQVSDDILRKCSGLPLAIVSIASILANGSNMQEQWAKVRASTGSGIGGMKAILSLSYSDLPQYLKTCLLYLSIFPEDYDIERGSLVRRWIAEGFINEDSGQIAEDVAENYFNELINRSMIQPVDIDNVGRARVCRVHDMMLELLKSKAKEENFVTIIGPSSMSTKQEGVARRLSIEFSDQDQKLAPKEVTSLTHVRSFSAFGHCHNQTLPFAYLKVLRVLSLDCQFNGSVDLKIICKLHQLKYLRLNASELPAEIGELQFLETLEWCNYSWGNLLPHGVARLQNLQHLLVDWEGMLPEAIGSMQSLKTLSHFNICDSPCSTGTWQFAKLRDLSISWDQKEPTDARYKECMSSSLSKLSSYSLQSLRINSKQTIPVNFLASLSPPPHLLRRFWMWSCYLQRCPKWIALLDRLTELKLDVWNLEDEDLVLLGQLPALLHLHLWVVSLRKDKIVIKETVFRSVVSFRLWSGLPCLIFNEKAMPKLETLELMFSACGAEAYGSTHSGIKHLKSLKNVRVELYTRGATPSNIEAAFRKIKYEISNHPKNLNTIFATSNYDYRGEGYRGPSCRGNASWVLSIDAI